MHQKYGGIVPNIAMETHKKQIDSVMQQALDKAAVKMDDIDAVGVTQGPGLEVCLRVGVRKAQVILYFTTFNTTAISYRLRFRKYAQSGKSHWSLSII